MKQILKLLFISLIFFSPNLFGVYLKNGTKHKITLCLGFQIQEVIEPNSGISMNYNELRKSLSAGIILGDNFEVIHRINNLPKEEQTVIIFNTKGNQIVVSGNECGEFMKIDIEADDKDSGEPDTGLRGDNESLGSGSSFYGEGSDYEENSIIDGENLNDRSALKSSGLLTLKTFAIVGTVGLVLFGAWKTYQKFQQKEQK